MKVFVTGGTGFIGTHLVNALLARGDDVTCLVRSPTKARALERRVRVLPGDLDAAAALREGCAGADVIYHLAGCIAARHEAEYLRANRDGTAHLLEAAAAQPPRRFVYISSLAAAGPAAPGRPIDETAAPHPVTAYGRSKLAAESLVRTAAFPWSIVRPPLVYGEGDRATLGIFRLARRGVVPLFGDGSQELSVVYGADLVAALLAVVATEGTVGRVYFAAHGEITTTRALALAVGRAVGKQPRLLPVAPPLARAVLWTVGTLARVLGRTAVLSPERAEEFLAPAWTCRVDALRADSGWEARTALGVGLGRTVAWYEEEGWL